MIGIDERTHNGIKVVRLHYTADPDKCTPEWKEKAKVGKRPRDWEREYEINWHIASGLPVYSDIFNREFHVAKEELLAYPSLKIFRSYDFGLTPACVWSQIDPNGCLNILADHVVWNGRGDMKQMGMERFILDVIRLSNEWFPDADFTDYADPAGSQKAQTDEKTCFQIMRQAGVYPIPGAVTWTARKASMVNILQKTIAGQPAMRISPNATMIIEGMEGAYKYEEIGDTGRYRETVEKNAWSHPMNALEYAVSMLYTTKNDREDEDGIKRKKQSNKYTGY